MVHTARVMRGLRLFVAQRRSNPQVPRIGSKEIVNLLDRILHSFRLRVYNPTDCLIVMHTKKRERHMLHSPPALFPGDLDDFVALVVPEVQRRGLFRTAYEGPRYAITSDSSALPY
jgi:hypothetical protein